MPWPLRDMKDGFAVRVIPKIKGTQTQGRVVIYKDGEPIDYAPKLAIAKRRIAKYQSGELTPWRNA